MFENRYENAFNVKVNKTEAVNELKEKIHKLSLTLTPKDIKLWKINISLEEENDSLIQKLMVTNIRKELGDVKLLSLSKLSFSASQ